MASIQEGLARIVAAVGRRKGLFAVGTVTTEEAKQAGSTAPFVLAVGAWSAVQLKTGGFVVTVGMTREHITELRDACDELLNDGAS